jgi:DNA cross-link repair 1C protein
MLKEVLEQLVSTGRNLPLDLDADTLSTHSAEEVIAMLVDRLRKNDKSQKSVHEEALTKTICFPYSRHSSLPELCHFVQAFQPKDVWPCTVNTAEWLRHGITVGSLFGRFCSSEEFEHDRVMQALAAKHALYSQNQQHDSQTTVDSDSIASSPIHEPHDSQEQRPGSVAPEFVTPLLETQASGYREETHIEPEQPDDLNALSESVLAHKVSDAHVAQLGGIPQDPDTAPEELAGNVSDDRPQTSSTRKRGFSNVSQNVPEEGYKDSPNTSGKLHNSRISENYSLARQDAYCQMLRNLEGGTPWTPLQLISTSNEYTSLEKEL